MLTKANPNFDFTGDWLQGPSSDYGPDDAGYYQHNPNPVFRRSFQYDGDAPATLKVAVLGYDRIKLNGQRIGHAELNSDWTDYAKRLYYDSYDVTANLHPGVNQIEVELGNGMYNPSPLRLFGKYNLRERLGQIGEPRALLNLIVAGQTVLTTDSSWEMRAGRLTFNNLYLGETWDNYHELDAWQPAKTVPVTVSERNRLRPSMIPKVTRQQTITPVDVSPDGQALIVDFGEVVSGFFKITLQGTAQQQVKLQYSETKTAGKLDFSTSYVGNIGSIPGVSGGPGAPKLAIQTDRLICREGEQTFENQFCYHSFRYVKIQGCDQAAIKVLQATYVHTDLTPVGQVKTDNPFLTQLFDAGMRTKLNNVHSIFEDCARERFGYGGDIVALAASNLYSFDLQQFYRKTLDDFLIEQTARGGLPETAPYMGIQTNGTGEGEGPILWQLVLPYLLLKQYQFYGERDLVQAVYPKAKRQLTYLLSIPLVELVQDCIGDHGSILVKDFHDETPDKEFIGYCTVLAFIKLMQRLAVIVEATEDAQTYQQQAEQLTQTMLNKFNHADGSLANGTQSAYAFALLLKVGDSQQNMTQLLAQLKHDQGIFTTGIYGTAALYHVLHHYQHDEIVAQWLTQDSAVSFKRMLATGNQVLAELFQGKYYSANHAMFTSYIQWFYEALSGIELSADAVGSSKIIIQPFFMPGVNQLTAAFTTIRGKLQTSWQRDGQLIHFKVQLPSSIAVQFKAPNPETKIISMTNFGDGQIMIDYQVGATTER